MNFNYVICANSVPRVVDGVNLWNEVMSGNTEVIAFPEMDHDMNNMTFCLQPEALVKKIHGIVLYHAQFGKPYVMLTASPYVLKAVDVYSDVLEVQQYVKYVNSDAHVTSFNDIMKPFSVAFSKLTHGEHYENHVEGK